MADLPDLWIIDDAGVTVPTQLENMTQAQEALGDLFNAETGEAYLFHPEDPITQLLDIFSTALASAYQFGEAIVNSRDPAQAQGVLLRELGSVIGTDVPQRARSVIEGRFLGNPGLFIPSRTILKYVETGDLWQTFTSYTVGAGGTVDVELESVEFAAIDAEAAGISAWELQTPLSGPATFLSTTAADVGRAVATNAETRDAIALAAEGGAGAATYDTDVANVAAAGATHVSLFVNRTLLYDAALDLEGKTARFVVDGARKQAIFDAIAASESTGLNTIATGAVQGTSTRPDGKVIAVSFSRPTDIPILFRVTISGDLPDDADVEEIVLATVVLRGADQDFGEKVIPVQYVGPITAGFDEDAVESCLVEVRLDSGDPWQATPIILDQTERADISADPRPAQVISVAEDPLSLGIGLGLDINADGGGVQSYVTTAAHTSVASLIEELDPEFTDVTFIDDAGRLRIRTVSEGGSSSLVLSGSLLTALGITAATYDGTDGDITVVIA